MILSYGCIAKQPAPSFFGCGCHHRTGTAPHSMLASRLDSLRHFSWNRSQHVTGIDFLSVWGVVSNLQQMKFDVSFIKGLTEDIPSSPWDKEIKWLLYVMFEVFPFEHKTERNEWSTLLSSTVVNTSARKAGGAWFDSMRRESIILLFRSVVISSRCYFGDKNKTNYNKRAES